MVCSLNSRFLANDDSDVMKAISSLFYRCLGDVSAACNTVSDCVESVGLERRRNELVTFVIIFRTGNT